jgi:hypothetical protein
MEEGFKKVLEDNPEAHIFCDEMPVGITGLPTKVLKKMSERIPGANVIIPFPGVIFIWVK